jgi:hypothetical protein
VEKDLQIDTLSSGMQSIYQISSHTNQLLQQQTKKNILQVLFSPETIVGLEGYFF